MLAPFLTRSPTQFRSVTSALLRAAKVSGLTFLVLLIGACSGRSPHQLRVQIRPIRPRGYRRLHTAV
jgi:hypothetical protein